MRTNIVMDDKLVAEAFRLTGARTKRQLVDLALRELVARKKRRGILSLEGKVEWEGDLDAWRTSRLDTG